MSTIDRPKPGTVPPLVAGQRLDRVTFHERYEAMPPSTRAELIGACIQVTATNDQGTGTVSIPITTESTDISSTPILDGDNNTIGTLDSAHIAPDAARFLRESAAYVLAPPFDLPNIRRAVLAARGSAT